MDESGGAKASRHGRMFEEKLVKYTAQQLGIESYTNAEYMRGTGLGANAPKFLKESPTIDVNARHIVAQWPYRTVDPDNDCRRDFVILNNGQKIEVEAKYQDVAGSVDKKIRAEFDDIGLTDCDAVFVVVTGPYWTINKKHIIPHLKRAAERFSKIHDKYIDIFTEEEYYTYILDNKGIL